MADDEDDYMSASFVSKAHAQVTETKRRPVPQFGNRKKGPAKPRSIQAIQEESLQQGLSSAITSENKGFQMLKMMGYKEGTGLGKDSRGNVEPVPLNLKRTRSGLGGEEAKKRKLEKQAMKKVKFTDELLSSFKDRMKDKFSLRKIDGQLNSIIRACRQMDERKGITNNELLPKEDEPTDSKDKQPEEEKDVDDLIEDFILINKYLRDSFHYCFFCGTQFDDQEDMAKNCPGPLEEDHD